MIKNKKNIAITSAGALVGVGTPAGIIYGIPSVANAVPAYASAMIIVVVALLAMLLTILTIKFIQKINNRFAEIERQNTMTRQLVDKLSKANGLGGLYLDNVDEAKELVKKLEKQIQATEMQQKKEAKL